MTLEFIEIQFEMIMLFLSKVKMIFLAILKTNAMNFWFFENFCHFPVERNPALRNHVFL